MVDSTNLPIDKEKETAVSADTGTTPGTQNAPTSQTAKDAAAQEIPQTPTKPTELPQHDRKEAKHIFNGFNFLGLHWVGNSALSLWITYNIVNKPSVQNFMHTLSKGMTPVVEGYDKIKGVLGLSKLSKLAPEIRANQISHSARSMTEVACMCVAGSIILFPVKWLEDHRPQILRATDELIHPAHKRERLRLEAEAREKGLPKPVEPEDPSHHKETWTNLIRARALALVPIFWIDGQMEAWNNARAAKGKSNINTWEWQLGNHTYDNMNATWREKIVNFFSAKGIKLSKVQHLVRDDLLKIVGAPEELKVIGREMSKIQSEMVHQAHDAALIAAGETRIAQLEADIVKKGLLKSTERAIFAEQTRMFSKEVSLSLIYTGFLFLLGKTNIVPWTMEKLGISKKAELAIEDAIEAERGLDVLPFNNPGKRNGNGHTTEDKKASPAPATAPAAEKPTQATAEPKETPKDAAAEPAKAAAGLSEPRKQQDGYTSRVKPKTASTATPSELYTKKLAAEDLSANGRTTGPAA